MPSALRTIAATLMALVVLLVATSLPGKAATLGPVETAICADETGRGDAQTFDVMVQPSWSPAVQVTVSTQRLNAPTLVPDIRRPTRGVLRL